MKTNIFKYIFFLIVIILVGLAIYMLYKDRKTENINIYNKELEINMAKELNIGITYYDNINPILSNNRDIQYIDKLIFESLLTITKDFKIENLLAKEFSKINSTTYIIKLKDDIYWHDNTKFTAKDVVFTIQNLINLKGDSIYKENVKNIQEAQVIDDYTVKIILKEETSFLEYMMCFPILSSTSYEEQTLNSKTELPVGTGKYKIVKMENGNIQIEKVNLKSEAKIAKINIIAKQSAKDLYLALTKDEIDFMVTDNVEYEAYIGTMGYNVSSSSGREYDYLALNNKNKILSNTEVRKVLSYAIDKKVINYKIYNNKYIVNEFPLDYGSYLYNNKETPFEYNISKAKSILVENGWSYKNNSWRKGGDKLEFNLLVKNNDERRNLVANEIKEQLNKIGIIINIVKVSDNMYNNYIKNKNYDIILTGNIVSTSPNIETYFGENNLSNFNNEQAKKILEEVKNISNEETLKEKYLEIQKIYKEQVPFISLYSNSIFVLTKDRLKGDLSHNWYNIFYNIDYWYKVNE